MPSEVGWYLYAFSPHGDLPPMMGIDGRSPLSLVAENGIAALSSPVPLTEFGEEALRRNLEDPSWLEEKVRLHESIVESALATGPLLPMRFGTIFLDQEKIRAVIRRNAPILQAALETLREKEEWGVKGFADPAVLWAAVIRNDPTLLTLSAEANTRQPGQAFFLRRRIEKTAFSKSRERQEALARKALEAIQRTVVELTESPPLPPEARRGETIVLNLACLVRQEGVEVFRTGLERWNRHHAEEGVRLVASGPWPPYHFVPELDHGE